MSSSPSLYDLIIWSGDNTINYGVVMKNSGAAGEHEVVGDRSVRRALAVAVGIVHGEFFMSVELTSDPQKNDASTRFVERVLALHFKELFDDIKLPETLPTMRRGWV